MRASERTRLLPQSGGVGSIRSRTRTGVLGHVNVTNERPFGPAERSESPFGDSGSDQSVPETYLGDQSRDTTVSDYFSSSNSGSDGFGAREYESQNDRLQRLINEAAKLLQDEVFSVNDKDVYDEKTSAAIVAARGAINDIKYPGGFSKNPLKAARTVMNVFRFIGDFHKKEVYAAEKQLSPLIIERAVKVAKKRGNRFHSDQVLAKVLHEARQFLPRSFQAGGGYWRAELKRKLQYALRPKTNTTDEGFHFGPAERSESPFGDSGSDQSVPETYLGDQSRDTTVSDYFSSSNSGSDGFGAREYESQNDRLQRLINEAAKLLQDEVFSVNDKDVYDEKTSAAIVAARGAINDIKYPGGFSKNPLKAARTVMNVFRFIGDFHKKEVYAAEKQLSPLIIERAVKVAKKRGNRFHSDQVLAKVLHEARQFLPRSFQAGGGYWRAELKRKLQYALRPKTNTTDEGFH